MEKDNSSDSPLNVYEKKHSIAKVVILGALLLVLAFTSGFFFESILSSGNSSLSSFLPYLPLPILFFILFNLNIFFISRRLYLNLINFIGGLALSFGLLKTFSFTSFVVSLIVGLVFILIGIYGKREVDNDLNIRFFRISRLVISRLIIIVALLVSFFFFDVFSSKPIDSQNPIIPQTFFEKNINSVSKIISPFLGNIDLSMSLNDIAKSFISSSDDLKNAPQNVKNMAADQLISGYQENFSSIFNGGGLDPDKKLSSAIYELFISKINDVSGPYKNFIFIGIAALIFLIILTLAPLLAWVGAFFAFLVYELFLSLGFAAVVFENHSKESVILP